MADLNEVFKEGDIDQLLLYLESMVSSESEDDSEKTESPCTGEEDCHCEDCNSEIMFEFEPSDSPEEKHECSCSSKPEGSSCGGNCKCDKKAKS